MANQNQAKGLDAQRLPPTGARPVPSIVISATGPAGSSIAIGAIKSMDRRISRKMTRRRELDSDVPGIAIEIMPGVVETFELTVGRAMMYTGSMLEAFGIGGIEDLILQNIPFSVVETRYNADGTYQVVTYSGCYFKDNPQKIDVDSDWIIVQDAVIEVTTCTVSGGPQAKGLTPPFSVTNTDQGPVLSK